MSIDIPTDLIRHVQTQIREQSGLADYDPEHPSLPSLPSFQDVISDFDPSPSYLRCKRCNGRLLSGVQSLFCVYCGAEAHDPDMPPEPIKFTSTFAYRWLLDSLKLDGSDIVGQGQAEKEPNRSQASPKKELTLSELLDLEIRWPERPKKEVVDKSPMNLAGVDVENFFPESKSVAAGSLEKPGFTVSNESIETHGDQDHEDVDLFADAASFEVGEQHKTDDSGSHFSGWATQFQGTTSVNSQIEDHSFDSLGESSDHLSTQIDTVFGSEKVEKTVTDQEDPPPGNNDWKEEDMWSSFSSGIPEQSDKLEARKHEVQDVSMKLDVSSNLTHDDWVLGDKWQTSSGKIADTVNVAEDDDSYDAWNDFSAISSTSQHQYNESSEPLSFESQAAEINLFSSTDLQDDVLGGLSQPALFSSSLPNNPTGMNQLQLDANVSDRSLEVGIKTEELDAEGKSEDYVETLMSQMHDLSFMLESTLSIPKVTPDS